MFWDGPDVEHLELCGELCLLPETWQFLYFGVTLHTDADEFGVQMMTVENDKPISEGVDA